MKDVKKTVSNTKENLKDKYLHKKEEMGELLEEEYEVEGKNIEEDTTGFSLGKKHLKEAVEKTQPEHHDK